jgi:error-prone DNA polymerase
MTKDPPPRYAEFAVTTNYSFLRGASHPGEFVARAMELGLAGLGIADRNSMAGIVRAHAFTKELFAREHDAAAKGLRVVSGARLVLCDGTPDILAYPRDRAAYGRLARLLTRGNARAQKGTCLIALGDLLEAAEGLQLAVMPRSTWDPDDAHKRATRIHPDLAAADTGPAGQDNRVKDVTPRPQAEEGSKSPSRSTRARGEYAICGSLALRDDGFTVSSGRGNLSPNRPGPDNDGPLLHRLAEATRGRVWLAATMTYGRDMRQGLAGRRALARKTRLPLLATNDVLMHAPERRPLQDVVTCIREGTTLDAAGYRLEANAERHLKDAAEMARLLAEAPEAVEETLRFLDGIGFGLDELAGDYPEELREGFATPQAALEAFAREGAERRYPKGVPDSVRQAIAHELSIVAELGYAPYFLTVHDIVRFARSRGILCQGRGSAANSTLCFCLGITEVDPAFHDLLFERFVSAERKEPPDIDVDFEHERREEVMQYIYDRYGRGRAGLTATFITYRARSAIREVGKAFGLSEDVVSTLSRTIWGRSSAEVDAADTRKAGLDPAEPRLAKALALAHELIGFPRHLSQHTGGFVVTRSRLDEIVPIANAAMDDRTTIEWDKDDLDALGLLKIDILALGMLSCLRKSFALLARHYRVAHTLASLPAEEPAVYAMISRADTIGVFQIESRAQMSMLPRLRPNTFYDLVIEVAIVRPGPIQGDMVHPYLRRRQGLEPVAYPSKELEAVLGKTLGVPLFQEQAMRIAIVAAGFTPSEADRLRRSMATFKHVGTIASFRDKMVEGMVARHYPREFALRCFKQIEGFGTYGFPESHAASFALLVYASAWMKCRYPDVFACALLNSQPMGFYAPSQILRDAREHGIPVDEIDINFSLWDSTLVPGTDDPTHGGEPSARLHPRHTSMAGEIRSTHRIRLGFHQIKGLREPDMQQLVAMRGKGYDSIRDLWLRTELSPSVLERLAEADAFRSLGLDRRAALWAVRGLNRAGDKDDLPLLKGLSFSAREPDAFLPPMLLGEHVVEDYRHLSLSLKAHPVAFVRDLLSARKMLHAEDLAAVPSGRRVSVAGLVLVRQRPGSAKGVIFLTLEDETGTANAIVWPKVFEALRPIVIGARFMAITGRLQNESGVIHIVVERAEDLTGLLALLSRHGGEVSALARADGVKRPFLRGRWGQEEKPVQPGLFTGVSTADIDAKAASEVTRNVRRVLPKGRNFQ